MKKSNVKKALIFLLIYALVSTSMFFGFDYLWQLYPEQEIFKTLMNFSAVIAYILVFTPFLLAANKKEKLKRKV